VGDGFHPPMRSAAQLAQACQTGQWDHVHPRTGDVLQPSLTPESKPQMGETIYALSKWAEERLALALGKRLGILTAALRYAVTYGPRQSVYNPYTGVVSIFTTRLLNGQAPVVYEDGRQTRDFLYVGDNARANLFVMTHLNADTAYQAYNVGTQQPTAIADLTRRLAGLLGKTIEPELRGDYRPGDVRHFVHDCSKLYALGWQPQTSLAEGLAQTVAWIQSQGQIQSRFDEAEATLRQCGVVCDGHGSLAHVAD
jgi:dTDP-L-rhamnose 4-epimerase